MKGALCNHKSVDTNTIREQNSETEPQLLYARNIKSARKCTYSAQYPSPRMTCQEVNCRMRSSTHQSPTCNTVPLYNTKVTSVQCPSLASATQSNRAQQMYTCTNVPPVGPPFAADDDLWNLQFCRWWGWNWLRKREEMMSKQKDLPESKCKRSSSKPHKCRSKKQLPRRYKDDFISRCRKMCQGAWRKKKLSKDEKKLLNHLYDTPCPSVTRPCCIHDTSHQSLHFAGEYECKSSTSQLTYASVVQPYETRPQRCKCDKRQYQSWVCEKTESSSSEECCPHVSARPRKPCGSTTEESIAYLSLRMERIKSDSEDNFSCHCACRERYPKIPCCSHRANPICNCERSHDAVPRALEPPRERLRKPVLCRRRCSPPPPRRVPVFRKPCNCMQQQQPQQLYRCSCNHEHPLTIQKPKCFQKYTKQSKRCPCWDRQEYISCPCQAHHVRKKKIREYMICCPCQLRYTKEKRKCCIQDENTQSPSDSCPNPRSSKEKENIADKGQTSNKVNDVPADKTKDVANSTPNMRNQVLQNLYDTASYGDYFQNDVTKALETGVYTSPASGRIYTLNPKILNTTIITDKSIPHQSNWPGPINFKESFAFNINSTSLTKTDEEHKRLLTAVCEAIMSSRTPPISEAGDNTFHAYLNKSPNGDYFYNNSHTPRNIYKYFQTDYDDSFPNSYVNSYREYKSHDPNFDVTRSPTDNLLLSSEPHDKKERTKYDQQNIDTYFKLKQSTLNWKNDTVHHNDNNFTQKAFSTQEQDTINITNVVEPGKKQAAVNGTYRYTPRSLEKFNTEPVCYLDYSPRRSREGLSEEQTNTQLTKPAKLSLSRPVLMPDFFSAVSKGMFNKAPPNGAARTENIFGKHIFGGVEETNVKNLKTSQVYNVLFSTISTEPGNDSPPVSTPPSLVLHELPADVTEQTQTLWSEVSPEELKEERTAANHGTKKVDQLNSPSSSKQNLKKKRSTDDLKNKLGSTTFDKNVFGHFDCFGISSNNDDAYEVTDIKSDTASIRPHSEEKVLFQCSENKSWHSSLNRKDDFHPYNKAAATSKTLILHHQKLTINNPPQMKRDTEVQYTTPDEGIASTSVCHNKTSENELRCVDLDQTSPLNMPHAPSFFKSHTKSPWTYSPWMDPKITYLYAGAAHAPKRSEELLTVINRNSEDCLADLHFIAKNLPSYSSISDTSSIASALRRSLNAGKIEPSQTSTTVKERQYSIPKFTTNANVSPRGLSVQPPPKLNASDETPPLKHEYVKNREEDRLAADSGRRKVMKRESPFSMFCVPVPTLNVIGASNQRPTAMLNRPERKIIVSKGSGLKVREKRWRY